jgi:hypothetical protein
LREERFTAALICWATWSIAMSIAISRVRLVRAQNSDG